MRSHLTWNAMPSPHTRKLSRPIALFPDRLSGSYLACRFQSRIERPIAAPSTDGGLVWCRRLTVNPPFKFEQSCPESDTRILLPAWPNQYLPVFAVACL